MKIAVLADGTVGQAVAEFLAEAHPTDVAAIVAREPSVFAPIALRCGAPFFSWEQRGDLRALHIDVLFLAWWPYILKEPELALAPTVLNMHPSLLPNCRGKDPNFWALVDDRPYGVTIHHVDRQVDAGPIAFQKQIPTDWESTGGSLYLAAQNAMIELFIESYPMIRAGAVPRIPQDLSLGGPERRRAELDPASMIELDAPTTARRLLNSLRARTFPPHPGCKFVDRGETYEVTVHIRRI